MILIIINVVKNTFILIEEPENHLHANYQKRLLKVINSIPEKQFFISTHSTFYLDSNLVNKIYYIENTDTISVFDQTSRAKIVKSLGYSVADNIVADLIILTEGPTDATIIEEILNWLGLPDKFQIKFWPLGGDIMSQLDLSVFAERKNILALIDDDPGSRVQRTRFIKKCKEQNIYCKKLERYSIENYFTLEAIKLVFPTQIPKSIKAIDPNIKIDDQLGLTEKGKSIKTKSHDIIKYMNIEDIKDTDLFDFINRIKNIFEE